jgi:hypothetical protein
MVRGKDTSGYRCFPLRRMSILKDPKGWAQWCMSIVPATWEAEIRRIVVQG